MMNGTFDGWYAGMHSGNWGSGGLMLLVVVIAVAAVVALRKK